MTLDERKRMLSALGLVDWQPRVDGALAPTASRAPTPVAAVEAQTTAAQTDVETSADTRPTAAASHSVADESAPRPAPEPEPEPEPEPDETSRPAPTSAPGDEFGPVSSMDWQTLEAWLATRDHRGASRPVFGIGARDADVLIVGEAPGANEDAQGVPFVGRAGKLLDRMLFAIGCSRETNVYITNICKFRPPNNRDPNPDEVAADWPVLERQIELMDPKLVVAVGRVAAQTLLDSKASLGKLRGSLHRYPRRELDVLVTYHPAFLLRSPGQKAKAWDDLKQIARRIAAA